MKPHFTEKTLEQAKKGKFTFLVDKSMTKNQIYEKVFGLFGFKAVSIATINIKQEKRKNIRGRYVRSGGFKKAVVKLSPGEHIDLFGKQEKKEKKQSNLKVKKS